MDGSSKFFVRALEEAGIKELDSFREVFVIKEVISYFDEKTGSDITIIPSDEYQVTTMVDFGTKILGTQNANLKKLSDFKNHISNSRTFSFLHELGLSTYTIALLRSPPFINPSSRSISNSCKKLNVLEEDISSI
jgi:UDP-3-O-[3-hydroxymyristoyl] N-acetylglucosamine deacetylase/3-hydroxyacyl-[acyl-carrier-protein] dehydratase